LISHTDILALLPEYGLAIVVIGVAIESLGVPLPGGIPLIAAAFYAGATGQMDPVSVGLAGAGGAMLGDNLAYRIGRKFGVKSVVRHGSRFGWSETRIKVGRYLFARYGAPAVFFGRFIPLIRALAAVLAGVNRMPWTVFFPANALGCVAWSAVIVQSGYAMGLALDSHALAATSMQGILIAAVILVILATVLRSAGRRLTAAADRAYPEPWS
jgi:membrane protein DedA with SNARE-associated domain